MPDDNEKRSNSSGLIPFLLALAMLCLFVMFIPNVLAVLVCALVGFTCGAAVGAFVSVKIIHQPWWSSWRWVIYGLVGMCLPLIFIL
jgi:hypothetical protein